MPARTRNPGKADLFEVKATPAPRLSPPERDKDVQPPKVLLPTDLIRSLTILSEGEFDRLHSGVLREAARRGKVVSSPRPALDWSPSKRPIAPERKATAGHEVAPAKASLVRAAFKAGVKPMVIARQFGLSPAIIRRLLAAEKP